MTGVASEESFAPAALPTTMTAYDTPLRKLLTCKSAKLKYVDHREEVIDWHTFILHKIPFWVTAFN